LAKDKHILEKARLAATRLLQTDTSFNTDVNAPVYKTLQQLEHGKGLWKYIS